jgi:hypothetical protein
MPLSSEEQSLFDHARNSLPRWLTSAASAALEWLYAFADVFDAARVQSQTWLDVTYIDNATGSDLDQHAADRGTSRRANETDAALRARLKNITDQVTEPALKIGINAILAALSLGPCTFVNLRRDRAHMHHSSGTSTSFMSRGYRMTGSSRPWGYIVILPYGTTVATANAVAEYLRQNGPAGFEYFVERRLNP